MATIGASTWEVGGPPDLDHLHLTPRGRRALVLGLLALLLVVAVAAGAGLARPESGSVKPGGAAEVQSTVSIVVEQGDSLWGIAKAVRPQSDPREVVGAIREANELRSGVIQPGQVLFVPMAP